VQVVALTPQATGRLLAIRPAVAKLFAVVALCKGILGLVSLNSDCNVAEA
jgi:hypothetical protein